LTASTGSSADGSTSCRAERPRQFAALGDRLDRDDLARTRHLRGLDHPLAQVPESDDGNARSRLHLGDVEDGAEAGRDPAAEQTEPLVREICLDREDLARGHVHHLGVAADVAGRADGLAVRAIGDVRPDPAAVEGLRALPRLAGRAVEADAALRGARDDRALTDLDVLDARPHLENLTHRRVTEDRRRDLSELAAPVDDVGRAERGRTGAEKHAAGRRVVVLDVLDGERPVELDQERSPHPPLLPSAGSGRNGFAAPAPPSTG
jgi:hypothetical protein